MTGAVARLCLLQGEVIGYHRGVVLRVFSRHYLATGSFTNITGSLQTCLAAVYIPTRVVRHVCYFEGLQQAERTLCIQG